MNTKRTDETTPDLRCEMAKRFRGFLPVVVDVETGGFNAKTDALLEIGATIIHMDEAGKVYPGPMHNFHILPFEGANLEPSALAFNGIKPFHPFRFAQSEQEALKTLFRSISTEMKKMHCHRAVLVGHNPTFDLSFIQEAVQRSGIKRNPFHAFTAFDTATLSALAYGETVLAKALKAARIPFDEKEAHSAFYDAEHTALLFCKIVNDGDVIFRANCSARAIQSST